MAQQRHDPLPGEKSRSTSLAKEEQEVEVDAEIHKEPHDRQMAQIVHHDRGYRLRFG